jgi:cytochrome c
LLKLIFQSWAQTIAEEQNERSPLMNSGFVKNILLSFAIAAGLLLVVNIIGELAIQPQKRTPPAKVEQPVAVKSVKEGLPVEAKKKSEVLPTNDITGLLATYNLEAGKKAFRNCQSCHTSEKGGKNRIGPNLWNVVGRRKGSMEGFKYSNSMKLKGGTWTFADLNTFLKNPRAFVVGTRMSIKGNRDPIKRAALIGYLMTRSDNSKAQAD